MNRKMRTMRNHIKLLRHGLLLGALASLGIVLGTQGVSRAQITLSKFPAVTNLGGGIYQWDYTATLAPGFTLTYGDFFNILDFDGLIAGSQIPASAFWSNYTNANGLTLGPFPVNPSLVTTPPDNPNLFNITWGYVSNSIPVTGTVRNLGTFSVLSHYGTESDGIHANQTHTSAGPGVYSVGNVEVSNRNVGDAASNAPSAASIAPEPSSMVLMLGGASVFPVLSLFRRQKGKQSKA